MTLLKHHFNFIVLKYHTLRIFLLGNFILITALAVLFSGATYSQASERTLHVWTYRSLASSSRSLLAQATKLLYKRHGIRTHIHTVATGAALWRAAQQCIQRSQGDLIIGLESLWAEEGSRLGFWAPPPAFSLPFWPNSWPVPQGVVPLYYNAVGFVVKHTPGLTIPTSKDPLSLCRSLPKGLALPEGRLSTVGLIFAAWVYKSCGNSASSCWQALKERTLTLSGTWSQSYTLFLQDISTATVSYVTTPLAYGVSHKTLPYSPLYMWPAGEQGYGATFETAAILQHSTHYKEACAFLECLLSPEIQRLIPESLFMFPVTVPPPDSWKDYIPSFKAIHFSGLSPYTVLQEWEQGWRTHQP